MATLYSQLSNKMMRRILPLYKKDKLKDNRLKRAYNIIELMVSKLHKSRSKEQRIEAYKSFELITPEHILETLHILEPDVFKLDPRIQIGFHIDYLFPIINQFFKIKTLYLDAFQFDNKPVYYFSPMARTKMIKLKQYQVYGTHNQLTEAEMQELLATNTFDNIVVSYRAKDNILKFKAHHVANRHIQANFEDDEKDIPISLTFKDEQYNLDSFMLTSFKTNTSLSHAIAGITCNNRRYMYNGWTRKTVDAAKAADEFLSQKKYPCELMPYDWINDGDDFCLSAKACELEKFPQNGLCFNTRKGERYYIYVNKKYSTAKYKIPKTETRSPQYLRSPAPVKTDKKSTDGVAARDESDKYRECIRRISNWTNLQAYHKFDNPKFDFERLKYDMKIYSPKMKMLLDTISELNKKDKKESGHYFKHFIFSDLTHGYGAKIIASALIANGYKLAYDKKHKFIPRENNEIGFVLLSSSTVYGEPMTQKTKKNLLSIYNSRPNNVHGQDIQIVILDSGFKEGIDLFDVKYVHIFEPQISMADQRQVIGRATRTCGQKGLKFDPVKGWPLEVRIYDTEILLHVRDRKSDLNTLSELYLQLSGIDLRYNNFISELEKYSAASAVDVLLTKAIHSGKITPESKADATKTSKKPRRIVIPKSALGGGAPTMLYKKIQTEVSKKFKDNVWVVDKFENLCDEQAAGEFKFHATQEFIRHYMAPSMMTNGLLAYHGVGVGKTCSAIAAASTSFENAGYTVLWVTRSTLKADMWKNMFDQVCNVNLKDKQIPKDMSARKRMLSKAWQIPPLSYKQFTNLLLGKNVFYKKLVSINGKEDPLRKTLLIIDEAHKLFNAEDLKTVERPDMPTLTRMLRNSYTVSGADSVKLLLMTATPITNDPMDFIKLMNLFKTEENSLPEKFDQFAQLFLNESGKFTKDGAVMFMNALAGSISYLNREKDARQFAQPEIIPMKAPISARLHELETVELLNKKYALLKTYEENDLKMLLKYKDIVAETKKGIKEAKQTIKKYEAKKNQDDQDKSEILKNKRWLNHLESQFKIQQVQLENNKLKIDKLKAAIKSLNEKKKQEKEKILSDFSQERMMVVCKSKQNETTKDTKSD